MSDSVNLTISKEIVNPIVNQKINEAITEALGGKDALMEKVISAVLNMRVDENGKPSTYSSAKPLIDYLVFNQVQQVVKDALVVEISKQSEKIKESLIRQIKTKKGSSLIAEALIHSMNDSLSSHYRTNFKMEFIKLSQD